MTSDIAWRKTCHRPASNERTFRVAIADAQGIWTTPLDVLPSFNGSVHWFKTDADQLTNHADLLFEVTTKLVGPDRPTSRPQARITALVDAPVPLGYNQCGALLACSQATLCEAVVAAASAVLTVAMANHVTGYEWTELLDVLLRDTLVIAAPVGSAGHDAIAACALRNLAYFQGDNRIEPEATMLGITLPQHRAPLLSEMGQIASSLRALTGLRCHQLTGYRLVSGEEESAFLLATYPIPALPGKRIRARRRWPR